ncbi:hypothetical protein L1O03_08450 [Corynebacterium uropygiale]|uniref:Uncharacterized protein n=1 Tax=Corynebacterium uropygiale TaxID=1775911 RepID=A0A9X1QRS2_9CORY|nr:hypothetical protein [Corynebacterium uropygiale]MCF4007202.1 hypothetical protein [Corynebacterium uropygiale]
MTKSEHYVSLFGIVAALIAVHIIRGHTHWPFLGQIAAALGIGVLVAVILVGILGALGIIKPETKHDDSPTA